MYDKMNEPQQFNPQQPDQFIQPGSIQQGGMQQQFSLQEFAPQSAPAHFPASPTGHAQQYVVPVQSGMHTNFIL